MGGRGSCRRKRSLRCVPCYAGNWHRYRDGLDYNGWEDVSVLANKGSGYVCQCRQCGHTYISYSSAARRQYQYQVNRSSDEPGIRENNFNSNANSPS